MEKASAFTRVDVSSTSSGASRGRYADFFLLVIYTRIINFVDAHTQEDFFFFASTANGKRTSKMALYASGKRIYVALTTGINSSKARSCRARLFFIFFFYESTEI